MRYWEKETDTHIYFWGKLFSQWYTSEGQIVDQDISYNCCEQYMMAKKAEVFGDKDIYSQIMAEVDPEYQKALGRKVSGYDENIWAPFRFNVVVAGNYLKFSQNEELKNKLLSTKNKTIVEASYEDSVWGIGLHINDPRIFDESNWLGENLLGKAIMVVRETFQN